MAEHEVDLMEQAEAERLASGYNWKQRAAEIAGITVFLGLTPLMILELLELYARSGGIPYWGLVVAGAIVASLLFSDWVSGLFHWAADNWGSADWPVLGTHFIRPFRHHHLQPEAMCEHDFVELNGNNCIISMPAFAACYWLTNNLSPTWALFWGVFWLGTAYWVFGTNQFHAWAHDKNPPKVVRALQKTRLILTPEHHQGHHTPPHSRNYGITNGWTNPIVRALRFYEMIEWTVTKLTGIRPVHAKLADELKARPAVVAERAAS